MHALFDALPASRQGAWASDSSALSAAVLQEIGAGDVVMIKGSNSIRMALIVDAMRNQFSGSPCRTGLRIIPCSFSWPTIPRISVR